MSTTVTTAIEPSTSPIVVANGVRYWVRELPCGSFMVGREFLNPRAWIDPWWTWVGGTFANRVDAVAALPLL